MTDLTMARQPLARTISMRISSPMLEAVDEYASNENKNRTEVIREAITQYLKLPLERTEERFNILDSKIEALNEKFKSLNNQISSCLEFIQEISQKK